MTVTDHLSDLAAQLGKLLVKRHWRISSAESCTGGWIAKCFTDIAGSSDWFEGSVVSYSNRIKVELLGVSADTIETDGAVSETVVRQMARGVIDLTGAEVSISVSGIAGPGGGSDDKPVGTVWLCWQLPGHVSTECIHVEGDREAVRQGTVKHAIEQLIQLLG